MMRRLGFNPTFNGRWLLAALFFTAFSASAQILSDDPAPVQADELRGLVTDVDEQADTLTIRPMEVGENLNIPTGTTQTFEVDANTIIRDDVYATQLDGLENIHENDIVRLEFNTDAGGRMVARTVTRDQDRQEADADRQVAQADRPQELPATASLLPLLAIFGAGSWGLALLIRLIRKRD
jgi:hypothetical protein